MHPVIGTLVSNCFYKGELESAREDEPLPVHLRSIASRPVVWKTTAKLPDRNEGRSGRSFINEAEAAHIAELLTKLATASATRQVRTEIVVLAAYKAQCRLLEQRLAPLLAAHASISVSVHTVDAFQGREAEAIIYSVTRSNTPGNLGFTRERPRLNVALSRARDLLIIVGDHRAASTRTGDNPFRDVLAHVDSHPHECEMDEV
jgi:superfamily I DNA and/or RNA helicase